MTLTLFIRHLESSKNINKTFSSRDDEEELTEIGTDMGREMADIIKGFIERNSLVVNNVYCANSVRAISTGKMIADLLGIAVIAFDDLKSNNSGQLSGKNEDEAKTINPDFVKQLSLFRAGLYSSYDFVKVYEREDKRAFEIRVNNCIDEILADQSETLKIIVLHHSSLTAALINFARRRYNYPEDFYGVVNCEIGNIYLINEDEVLLCNVKVDKLLEVTP